MLKQKEKKKREALNWIEAEQKGWQALNWEAEQDLWRILFSFQSSQKKIMVNSFMLDLIFSMN